jgi:hypothetical protein
LYHEEGGVTTAQIMRIYGDWNQVIDSETSSDKALLLAMTLYVKDLEKRLDLESGEEEAADTGEAPVLSWADFLGVVEQTRAAQKRYFKTRERDDLIRSKTLEKAVDRAVDKIKAARAAAGASAEGAKEERNQ